MLFARLQPRECLAIVLGGLLPPAMAVLLIRVGLGCPVGAVGTAVVLLGFVSGASDVFLCVYALVRAFREPRRDEAWIACAFGALLAAPSVLLCTVFTTLCVV